MFSFLELVVPNEGYPPALEWLYAGLSVGSRDGVMPRDWHVLQNGADSPSSSHWGR
jgi:hypothetical protein